MCALSRRRLYPPLLVPLVPGVICWGNYGGALSYGTCLVGCAMVDLMGKISIPTRFDVDYGTSVRQTRMNYALMTLGIMIYDVMLATIAETQRLKNHNTNMV